MNLLHEPRRISVADAALLALICQHSDLFQFPLRQLDVCSTQILFNVLELLGTWDRQCALCNKPGNGNLRGGGLVCRSDLL